MPRETMTRRRRPVSDDKYDPTPDESGDEGYADDQDEAPKRGSRRGSARSEEKPSGRRGRVHTEDGDEDEKPRGRRGNSARDEDEDESAPRPKAGKGWGAFSSQKSESSEYAENLKIDDKGAQSLIKFLDEGPFAVYSQHWIERKGKKSFNCIGKGCPLCDSLGDKPRLQAAFNVIEFPEDGDPKVLVWTVGTKVATQLENLAKEERTKPLNRDDLYWAVSKSGKGTATTYSIQAVKERDLEDDWDTQPLTEDEFVALDEQAYDDSEITYQTKKALRDIADEVLDD